MSGPDPLRKSLCRPRIKEFGDLWATRISLRIVVEQKRYAAGMVDTQGWQFET